MSSQELIRSGRLAEAKAALQLEVKDNPQDYRLRTSLFELLCVIGEWQRADHTLAVMADESVEVAEGVVLYRKLLAAEAKRREFLAGGAWLTLWSPVSAAFVRCRHARKLTMSRSGKIERRRLQ